MAFERFLNPRLKKGGLAKDKSKETSPLECKREFESSVPSKRFL